LIIGINGAKGSGKDTVANYLVEKYGFTRIGFADALKESCAALFNVPPASFEDWKNNPDAVVQVVAPGVSKILSFREILQRYGTESHREVFGDNFWVEVAMKKVNELDFEGNNVVISDMRFPNELDAVANHSGILWKIRRPGYDVEQSGDTHQSEQFLADAYFDAIILNNASIDGLYETVDEVMVGIGLAVEAHAA
jgi:Deoxynucleotide monophosphate kinase